MAEAKGRTVGSTECSWCRAVRGGTGIAVVALRTSKPPDPNRLQNALHILQNSHPILRSTLLHTTTFSFLTSPTPFLQLASHDLSSQQPPNETNDVVSPLQLILERELNNDSAWRDPTRDSNNMFFATLYSMPNDTWVVALRLHVAACDRTTAVLLLRELLALMMEENAENTQNYKKKDQVNLAIEDLVPRWKTKKALWSRGLDVLGYSLNSFRLANLKFNDTKTTRFSQVLRLQLNQNDTTGVLTGCEMNGIKLCGALSAAGLMAAHCSKRGSKKYGIITFTDCRSTLELNLSDNFGFYHSAVLNCHEIKGGETLWELAKRTYGAFENYKKCNKHYSDMADLNFLMCKAIENPSLTSSSSLRTAYMSVFEDTVVDNSGKKQKEIGVEDYMGCASTHGVGPSIAIFDTIRDGSLDCVCVYPAPLHTREQMQEVINKMRVVLIECAKAYKEELNHGNCTI